MRAHDAHGDREIFRGPAHADRAHAVWRAQNELAIAQASPATATDAANRGHLDALAAEVSAGQAALGGRVFRVPIDRLDELRRRIERLDRRARRRGTGEIELVDVPGPNSDGRTFVVLAGRTPVLAGWSLAAIVEHRAGQSAMRPVGDLGEGLATDEFATPRCEHCRARRRRVETFIVVRPESGEVRQVGSGCLRDFVGGHDPVRACRQAEYMALARATVADAAHSPNQSRVSHTDGLPVEAFVACAAHVVRAQGWISAERGRRSSSRASADAALEIFETARETPDRADRALAAGALRWARALLAAKPEPTAFEREALVVVADGSVLTRRERGLVCALVAVYRHKRARSRHLGDRGRSIEVTALVERVVERPSARYGIVRRCDLLDADANRLVWWQTHGRPVHEGQVLVLRGRVVRHTHFGNTAVTVIAACRPVGQLSPRNVISDMGPLASRRLT